MTVTALQAREASAPDGVEPLDWRLLTNRPATTLAQAAELLKWYEAIWSIEFLESSKPVAGGSLKAQHRGTLGTGLGLVPDHRLADSVPDPRWAGATDLPCDVVLDSAEMAGGLRRDSAALHQPSRRHCRPCSELDRPPGRSF